MTADVCFGCKQHLPCTLTPAGRLCASCARDTDARRIEIWDGPDSHGRFSYTLFWMADYHPGHPLGEYRHAERGQCFFGDPSIHGVPSSRVVRS